MENNQRDLPGRDPGYGPRPARRSQRPAMSAPRADILDRLTGQPEPITVATLSRATGLHENTVRGHLDALVAKRLIRRKQAPTHGRGRPAWLYAATDQPPAGGGDTRGYAGLAAALAGQIQRSSTHPRADALEAGISWGRELATANGANGADAATPRTRVVQLLGDLGFGPRPDAQETVVKLTRCPLLEAANRYPEVVCAVHVGIVRGALDVYGGDTIQAELMAFAEPGACRLELPAMPASARAAPQPTAPQPTAPQPAAPESAADHRPTAGTATTTGPTFRAPPT